jgi:hypothetical protein
MKRVFIASIVAAIIVFAFQAMSWMFSPIHTNSFKYTPNQDAIISTLSSNLTEEGLYSIPSLPPEASQADHEKAMKDMEGKPGAIIQYTPTYMSNMGMSMGVGFLLDFLAAWIIALVLSRSGLVFTTFGTRWLVVMGFAVFVVLQARLMDWNWWHTPMHYINGEIIDMLVSWALGGLWLAWYAGRGMRATTEATA